MPAATIRADGMEWPLQTYLDAMSFSRVDQFAPPAIDGQIRVTTVSLTGELAPSTYASQVRWHDVLAFRPIANGLESTPCETCGDPVMRTDCAAECASCEDDRGDIWGDAW
jgi:hypothetical protein